MTENLRSVEIVRTGPRSYEAVNVRGGRISFGEGQDTSFTPVELLLAAAVGCSAIDVDYITGRRAEPETFEATASAPKLSDDKGNHLGVVTIDFRITFPQGPDGDRAREVLTRSVAQSRDRLCTVSRTIQLPTAVDYRIDGESL
ncbi:MAG: OsmC family protein [Propionicimonas sp.]|uniref:OsmC family protein n=1 Tax=Propionicimonas sp. TaxID=1955623 RepID=UPI003D0CF44A